MKIYKLTYEEIDTNDPTKSINESVQKCISDKELELKSENIFIDLPMGNFIKTQLWDELSDKIMVTYLIEDIMFDNN